MKASASRLDLNPGHNRNRKRCREGEQRQLISETLRPHPRRSQRQPPTAVKSARQIHGIPPGRRLPGLIEFRAIESLAAAAMDRHDRPGFIWTALAAPPAGAQPSSKRSGAVLALSGSTTNSFFPAALC